MDSLYMLNSVHDKLIKQDEVLYGHGAMFRIVHVGIDIWVRPIRNLVFIDRLNYNETCIITEQVILKKFSAKNLCKSLLPYTCRKKLVVLYG